MYIWYECVIFSAVCQAGEYYYTDEITDDIRCRPCAVGTYNPNRMASQCEKCASGETTLGTGKKSKDDCIGECNHLVFKIEKFETYSENKLMLKSLKHVFLRYDTLLLDTLLKYPICYS